MCTPYFLIDLFFLNSFNVRAQYRNSDLTLYRTRVMGGGGLETGGCFINWSFRKEGKVGTVHMWSIYYLLGTVRAGYAQLTETGAPRVCLMWLNDTEGNIIPAAEMRKQKLVFDFFHAPLPPRGQSVSLVGSWEGVGGTSED